MRDDRKWLLLIPVFFVALGLGFLSMQLLNDDGNGDNSTAAPDEQSQDLQVQLKPIQERIVAYEALLQRNPSDADAIKGMGDSYLEIGAYQDEAGKVNDSYRSYKSAVDQYRKYLLIKSDDVEVRKDLGLVYSYMQMTDIALRELRAATVMDPNSQRAWHSLGYVLYNNAGNLTEAREAWQKSYDLNPGSDIGLESKSFLDTYSSSQISVPQSIEP